MRLWSAACSSGEEPYTMSIILLESGIPERVPVTIYATDINPRLLNAAQRGVYSEEAVASLPTRFVEKYFARHEDGYHLNEKVKGMVQFGTLNLYQETWPDYLAELDVILCRNVVMYLTKPAREKVVERLHRCMSPNGFLMLGHAESLPKISTSLISRNISKETVYQKSFIENIGGP
jgi:chemotaxis protein methyltransferase CheR